MNKKVRLLLCSFTLLLLFLGCKKNDNNSPCGTLGGVIGNHTYLFWIDRDFGCGAITVELKDADGRKLTPFYGDKITVWNVAEPADCSSTSANGHAVFQLMIGQRYTYKASCSSRSWSGTIIAPCVEYGCSKFKVE